ncbi:MAG: SurA N-terminal domain-containing protein [Sphingomonas sp.]
MRRATSRASAAPAGGQGDVLAKVGKRPITERELQERIDVALGNMRRQGRAITMQDFIAQGGVELALDQTVNSIALEEFAKKAGMQVSTALVDGEIASIPAFQGVDGKFDQKTFEARLARERVSPLALREDMKRDRLRPVADEPPLGGQPASRGGDRALCLAAARAPHRRRPGWCAARTWMRAPRPTRRPERLLHRQSRALHRAAAARAALRFRPPRPVLGSVRGDRCRDRRRLQAIGQPLCRRREA